MDPIPPLLPSSLQVVEVVFWVVVTGFGVVLQSCVVVFGVGLVIVVVSQGAVVVVVLTTVEDSVVGFCVVVSQ